MDILELISLISFVFYSILPPEVAFNSLFARIWQFIIGMMIYLNSLPLDIPTIASISYKLLNSAENGETENESLVNELSEDEEEEDIAMKVVPSKPTHKTYIGPFSKYCFLIPMGFVVTYPIAMFPFLVRIPALAVGLLASGILAVVVYETYEKWYLKLSNRSCALLIVLLFIVNVVLINKDAIQGIPFMKQVESPNGSSRFERLDGVNENMTFDDATRLNQYWNKYDLEMMIEPGCIKRTPKHSRWCDYELKGDEFKIAIFGNSYTKNHHKMFIQECKNRAYNITVDSERGCEPLAATPNDHGCVKKLSEFVEFIESAKPDYAFIFTR
ncbi:hypothetical protein CAEBREN_29377 [Caenorhabditis brenneri]|uniref:SGNH domain-containing protein n=1 Tax=Caenorhabditis brenneri TaxID=135651 RepID=G0P6Y0_CAEBE|nr:hypothetical protein CAEBREN_29377 [Caenorhabditis brenneri]